MWCLNNELERIWKEEVVEYLCIVAVFASGYWSILQKNTNRDQTEIRTWPIYFNNVNFGPSHLSLSRNFMFLYFYQIVIIVILGTSCI
jgi:hypothetical protein